MAPPAQSHRLTIRVYYEDTDLAGIVYYANYLKFIERARTEWVRGLGIDQTRVRAEAGVVFAVRRIEADYVLPARFDDLLSVETKLVGVTAARVVLGQRVWRDAALLFDASVMLVALTETGAPRGFRPSSATLSRACRTDPRMTRMCWRRLAFHVGSRAIRAASSCGRIGT
jgi:acyl-CoA thioester hydrolase